MECSSDRVRPRARGHVLLVCDDPLLLESVVSPLGAFRVRTAHNGLMGVEMVCRAIVNDDAFDVVIAQLDMAVLNGPEVLQRIRSICPETRTVLLAPPACRASLGESPSWADHVVSGPAELEPLLLALRSRG
jgi:CheY-like chemotaxis protein